MFEIDGSQKSGSGTILRLAICFSAIRCEPVHIFKIRRNRPKPGLQPQHLEAVLTAAKLCNAETKGATLGSEELWFIPDEIRGGRIQAEIGTAGNIPMLFMTILPMCLFAKEPVQLTVTKGGTDTMHAPTINYLRNVFLSVLKSMGVETELSVHRYGYYPRGNGEAVLRVEHSDGPKPFRKESFGTPKRIQGVSVCTFLSERNVAERQAKAATAVLTKNGYNADIQIVKDTSNSIQKGSSIALWAETDTGAILGSDAIGEFKKPAEKVGTEAAEDLMGEISSRATVDTHLADMLIPYIALARGSSTYLTRAFSDHLDSNIWLAQKMLNTNITVKKTGTLYNVEKMADA